MIPTLHELKQAANLTQTENGAATYASTGSDCLDLFATIGALRRESDQEIITRFFRAFAEDKNTAMKLLFFARDVRGGLGERRVFRVILPWLAENAPDSLRKNIPHVAAFGRWDDLLTLLGTPCEGEAMTLIRGQFAQDMAALQEDDHVSLLGKWLPSVNASNPHTVQQGRRMAKTLGLTEAAYRKALSALREKVRIIENNLRVKDYTFDYEKQPSRALFKYRAAFHRHDEDRYQAFLAAVAAGKATLHADHVAPYELVEPYLGDVWARNGSHMRAITPAEKSSLNATWAALPDFGGKENTLAVIDTSGSMYLENKPLPAAVALSLGLYFAERNRGAFANHFITFSERPQLIEIKGDTFADRLRYVATFSEAANTNLEAVFHLILRTAVACQVPQAALPAKLVIISDMEFDQCMVRADAVHYDHARDAFAAQGYQLPDVVFWNVASRNRHQPVTQNAQGVAMVSGATPRLFSMIAGGTLSPYAFMMEVLGSERYDVIVG